ncbi:MAG: dihydroneopterin aldolase [Flammeovirgaceae bacterium]|jgi:7,8-dihydroneopterin aldolase/epimerase/oxygenase|nr:dihydroneopterin aldolase [Flammeovirgaceae bacterium]|tara:strand:- start:13913 stop:14263 length:351 start_codon:yes stop_codon:yes gene_type:complete
MGLVSLEGMEFYAYHGYHAEERKIGNKYSIDVKMELNFDNAALHDQIEGTVDYEQVYLLVASIMEVQVFLLEHLAGKIMEGLKNQFPQTTRVWVEVSKFNPPINGLCHRAVVAISS